MLHVKNVSFRYGTKEILKNVSFDVEREEIVAILGPSGCGKTTLFQLITGLQLSSEGAIRIQGLAPANARPLMTYMMQKDLLLPWKKVLDNLLVIAKLTGQGSKKDLREKALLLLKEVGLEGSENLYPYQLSGGMRQRVALARSLLLERPLLLLDEPFSSIDMQQRNELYGLLKKIQKEHKLTILFITHDVFEAYKLADRIFFLEEGHLTLKNQGEKSLSAPFEKDFSSFFPQLSEEELLCGGK